MAESMNGLSREFIIHPGDTLKEVLEDREMSQRELAIRTDVTETHISNVVNCQKAISVTFAKKLEYALAIDASFWINLQANYDKELADFEEVNKISCEELEILKKLKGIVEYMQQIRLLDEETNDSLLVIILRKKLNISNLIRIPDVSQAGAYRLAATSDADPHVLFTWLRMCDLITASHEIDKALDIKKLKGKITYIKKIMFENVTNIQPRLRQYFAECGIKFSIVKNFRGAPVQGVIKKDDDALSLIMTNRYKFADVFWFTLFHEIGHIISGDIEDKLVDYGFVENEAEKRADEFATNTLIDSDRYEQFVKSGDYSLNHINQFCSEIGVPNYILIGRLQRDGHLEYYRYSTEKVKYEIEDLEILM
jgi:HTH-type transcriptional regulator/antitoxin HigA